MGNNSRLVIYNNLGQMTEGRLTYFRSTDIEQGHWERLLWSVPDEMLYYMSQEYIIVIRDTCKKPHGKVERIFVPVLQDLLRNLYFGSIPLRNDLIPNFLKAKETLNGSKLLYQKFYFWKGKIGKVDIIGNTIKVNREQNPLEKINIPEIKNMTTSEEVV